MEDKKIICKDCYKEFIFTVGEQEFYKEKGFTNEPTRCADCRRARKQKGDVKCIVASVLKAAYLLQNGLECKVDRIKGKYVFAFKDRRAFELRARLEDGIDSIVVDDEFLIEAKEMLYNAKNNDKQEYINDESFYKLFD